MQPMSTTEAAGLRNIRLADRRFPRLCANCASPMTRQEVACWRCGTRWAPEHEPRAPLRLIRGGMADDAADPRRAAKSG